MKRYQFIIVLIVVVLVVSLVGIGVSYSASPAPPGQERPELGGRPTFIPLSPLPTFFSLVADIPDPNLDEALHQKLGKPMSQDIYYMELAGITGTLYLDNKDISNAQGVQYCTSITGLSMENNNLTTMPDFTYTSGLEFISLRYNDFTEFPMGLCTAPNLLSVNLSNNPISSVGAGISSFNSLGKLWLESCSFSSFPTSLTTAPNLCELRMGDNNLGSIPTSIDNLGCLNTLYLPDCGISSIPSQLYSMTSMKSLDLSGNDISSLSPDISGMNSLEYLMISRNNLEALPQELFDLPHFKALIANENSLYSLPDLGGTAIEQITVRQNRITRLPSDIGDASNLYLIDVMVNRIRELPSSFDDKSYDFINVEFNFIDMAPGSDSRTIIDNTTSFNKYFERQLKPIEEVTAVPSDTSIALSWTPGEDGSSGGATWNVDSYKVYLTDSYTLVDELLPTELTYEHTGLTPETTYLYHVGVDYHVVVPSHSIDTTIRAYTDIEPTTLAEIEATPAASAGQETPTAAPQESAEVQESPTPGAVEIDITDEDSSSGLPVWAIVVICVLGAGVLAAGATLIVMKVKGKNPVPRKGHKMI